MPGIVWDENYSIGIDHIDKEHKQMITMINNALGICRTNGEIQCPLALVGEMKRYATTHFATEERHMQQSGYPQTEEHMAEHRYFTEKVNNFEAMEKSGKKPDPAELYRFLSNWLISHIMNCDKGLGSFLVGKGLA